MARRGSRRAGVLILFLLAGIMIGSYLGNVLAHYFDHSIFTKSIEIGTIGEPALVDLGILNFTFGLTFIVNIGTVFGILLGLFLYKRW
ncbi:MAG: DUF4321 domain-containing protein [Clostridiales bacterium]|nr:DUF4321 domain-containing protein [Clostridiales bacterium]